MRLKKSGWMDSPGRTHETHDPEIPTEIYRLAASLCNRIADWSRPAAVEFTYYLFVR
jgi:hypothetical protein